MRMLAASAAACAFCMTAVNSLTISTMDASVTPLKSHPTGKARLALLIRPQTFHHVASIDEVVGEAAGLAQRVPHEGGEGLILFAVEASIPDSCQHLTRRLEVAQTRLDVVHDAELEREILPPLLWRELRGAVLLIFFSDDNHTNTCHEV